MVLMELLSSYSASTQSMEEIQCMLISSYSASTQSMEEIQCML